VGHEAHPNMHFTTLDEFFQRYVRIDETRSSTGTCGK
jgi:hypothetical protein